MTLEIGDNVYLKDPGKTVPGYTCFVGEIVEVIERPNQRYCLVDGCTGKMGGGGYEAPVCFPEDMLGLRYGTPVSKISVYPGTAGYGEWLRISQSWGYE